MITDLLTLFIENFNPRSREGSDFNGFNDVNNNKISIHAPVKGATVTMIITSSSTNISIHAPVKGATLLTTANQSTNLNFNPRSREGSDQSSKKVKGLESISIHAPVKGATSGAPLAQFKG